ncbi:hypothetical protein MPLB_160025 [Mesorhizobium sp. ORS 3324]|nr:hypothetical protein MPLB_160025 [Mesorhizobium sp. ORS 3324]
MAALRRRHAPVCGETTSVAVRPEPGRQESEMVGKLLHGAAEQHVDGHVQDDQQAEIGNPAIFLQQTRDKGSGKAHQGDRQGQADDEHRRVLHGGAGDGEHVVERHGDVGDDDLPGGLRERLARPFAGGRSLLVVIVARQRFGRVALVVGADAQLAPHLPAHPKKQQAARDEQHRPDAQQPLRDQGEQDAKDRGRRNADEDGSLALICRQAGCRKSDHDCIVTCKREVDRDNLDKGRKACGSKYFHKLEILAWAGVANCPDGA